MLWKNTKLVAVLLLQIPYCRTKGESQAFLIDVVRETVADGNIKQPSLGLVSPLL